jgi:integrase
LPRPRKDGIAAAPPRRAKLSIFTVARSRAAERPYLVWDVRQAGLALAVQPTGARSYKVIYSFHGRSRWLTLGDVRSIGLAEARTLAAEALLAVRKGNDPAAEKRAQRHRGTFAEVAERYVAEYAKRHNKSWKQGDALVRRHLLPRWGKLPAHSISRADVRSAMARIPAPIVANQVLAAASAIFSWAINQELITVNPCRGVDRNPTTSRERVLSNSEIPKYWAAFDEAGLVAASALKMILLTGQRPGEVAHMRREHIVDGWWELPGAPTAAGWPGTKNGAAHRVWLPKAALAIIEQLDGGEFVFANERGGPVGNGKLDWAMRALKIEGERATPHDLRRTQGTTIAAMGFGRDAMNRIQNHREGGIASVYDRHQYADENKKIMEVVAAHFISLIEGSADNVIAFRPGG